MNPLLAIGATLVGMAGQAYAANNTETCNYHSYYAGLLFISGSTCALVASVLGFSTQLMVTYRAYQETHRKKNDPPVQRPWKTVRPDTQRVHKSRVTELNDIERAFDTHSMASIPVISTPAM